MPLDITRGVEIWAYIQLSKGSFQSKRKVQNGFPDWLDFHAGYGVGKFQSSGTEIDSSLFGKSILSLSLNLLPIRIFVADFAAATTQTGRVN